MVGATRDMLQISFFHSLKGNGWRKVTLFLFAPLAIDLKKEVNGDSILGD